MKIFSFFFYSIVCLVATTLNAPNNVYASNNTIPIGFQFFTASNIPIPNETFQLQLDNEVKYLTTRSDGLAFIEIPSKNIKTQYTLTTSNQQTFTVEPNKLYQLTSSDNQLRNTPTINNQSITIDVLSKTYQPLSNIEVKLLAQNQEFIGKTNNDGTTTINIPSNIPKDTKFNVTINGIDTHSTISIGEDKYYTFNSDNKSVSPFIQDSMQHTQLDNNQQNQQTQANTLNNSNN
ncbi:LPXTG cell wall anchor domain-containing protein, partial [Mammaliicoccus vitulinus]